MSYSETGKKKKVLSKLKKYMDFSSMAGRSSSVSVTLGANKKTALVSGVEMIIEYTDELVSLQERSGRIVFLGEALECLTYASGAIEISGKIKHVTFASEEKDG